MKHIFIVNRYTIKNVEQIIKNIHNYCRKEKIKYEIEVNNDDYSTDDILKKYKKGENIIFAIGGDGMINRVLNGIMNTKNVLGIIPNGTGNDLYRSIKEQFQENNNFCDVVKINERYFINTACFGIDADVANNKEIIKYKWLPKKQKYNLGLIYSFFHFKSRKLKINIEEQVMDEHYTTVAVCNGCYYGSGYHIAPFSNLQDGLLDVYFVSKLNKIAMLNLILKMKKGKHENSKYIRKFRTKKLVILSDKTIKCNIDGESLEDKIFNIELIEKGISIYYDENIIGAIIRK